MKTKNRITDVEISGWVHMSAGKDYEITVLQIEFGEGETRIPVDLSGDEMVEWCKHHNHKCVDMRNRG